MANNLADEHLVAEEMRKWELWQQRDVDTLEQMYAEDWVEVDISGRGVVDKSQAFREVRELELVLEEFSLNAFRVVHPTPEVAIVIYRAELRFSMHSQQFPVSAIWASSTWVNRGGRWLTVYYQATAAQDEQ